MDSLDREEVLKIEYLYLGTLPPPNRTELLTIGRKQE